MAYSTFDDMRKEIPEAVIAQLTDDANGATVDPAKVDEAIAAADAEIDPYLGVRFGVPLPAPIPSVIKKISTSIAIYNLYSRRQEEMPQTRRDRYKDSIHLLEKIADGSVSIGQVPAPAETENQRSVDMDAAERVFSRDKMKGF